MTTRLPILPVADDKIDVSGIWQGTFGELMDAATESGGSTVISVDGGTITLNGVAKADLLIANFPGIPEKPAASRSMAMTATIPWLAVKATTP